MRRMMRGLVPALVVVFLAACSSPEPAYFTMAPVPGQAVPGGPRTVELRRPGLAGYLDRPEIVRASGQFQLRVASTERWGEPFGDLVGRITAENLTSRLPGTAVFTSAGSISTDAEAAVELDIQRFDLDPAGQVVLLAQVAVQRGRARTAAAARPVRLTVQPTGPGTPALVAAMSNAMGQLADAIAALLRAG